MSDPYEDPVIEDNTGPSLDALVLDESDDVEPITFTAGPCAHESKIGTIKLDQEHPAETIERLAELLTRYGFTPDSVCAVRVYPPHRAEIDWRGGVLLPDGVIGVASSWTVTCHWPVDE